MGHVAISAGELGLILHWGSNWLHTYISVGQYREFKKVIDDIFTFTHSMRRLMHHTGPLKILDQLS